MENLKHSFFASFIALTIVLIGPIPLRVRGQPISPPSKHQLTGILLEGNPKDLAVTALKDYSAQRTTAELEVMADSKGGPRFYTRQIQAVLADSAKIGEVNLVLEKIQGRIVWSMHRNRVITIQIAHSRNPLDSLNKALSTLNASTAFSNASRSSLPSPLSPPR